MAYYAGFVNCCFSWSLLLGSTDEQARVKNEEREWCWARTKQWVKQWIKHFHLNLKAQIKRTHTSAQSWICVNCKVKLQCFILSAVCLLSPASHDTKQRRNSDETWSLVLTLCCCFLGATGHCPKVETQICPKRSKSARVSADADGTTHL